MPRYTEANADVRTIPAAEIWVGIINARKPYIAIASRLDSDDEPVIVCRFGSTEAKGMAAQLVECAASLEAPTN
jgi:hypothetical protein